MESIFAYAQLNARVLPLDRGDLYEDPLQDALDANGWAAVTGGGTMQQSNGEIEYCGIDIELNDVENAVPFICKVLESCGAPRGSKLTYEINGTKTEVPFGKLEGLGIYLNGTDLPDEVYQNSDINYVIDEINRRLGDLGAIQGNWQGPTETALYLYGYSIEEMKNAIADLMAEYPLFQRAKIEAIA
jgi:hypothetical protein